MMIRQSLGYKIMINYQYFNKDIFSINQMKNMLVYQENSTSQNTLDDFESSKGLEFPPLFKIFKQKNKQFLSASSQLPGRAKNKIVKRLSVPEELNESECKIQDHNPQGKYSLKLKHVTSQKNLIPFKQIGTDKNKPHQLQIQTNDSNNHQLKKPLIEKRLKRISSSNFSTDIIQKYQTQILDLNQKEALPPTQGKNEPLLKVTSVLERLTIKQRLQRLQKLQKNTTKNIFQNQEQKISNFQFISLLGTGQESQVFLARHSLTNMLFAIKSISKETIKVNSLEQNIFRELKIHSFLNHKNIVSLYKILSDEKNIYMIMEYAYGGTVLQQLKKCKIFSQQKTARIIKDIAKGLKIMHDNDIIHRDLKLENVVLNGGIAKIADFGCSVHSFRLRRTLIGSPIYLSPEQLNKVFYGKKTDIWSVGIMTYQMLFGFSPFEKQIIALLHKNSGHSQFLLKYPSYSSVSPIAKDFLSKCLQNREINRMNIEQLLDHPFLKIQHEEKLN